MPRAIAHFAETDEALNQKSLIKKKGRNFTLIRSQSLQCFLVSMLVVFAG